MKKTNKDKLEQFIRVNHAGEREAIKIYEGQLLALNTIIKDKNFKKKLKK
jgi:ubiquinone biosynthesis monooxygenase Coq7|tara:strand:- start:552 stop:701 length:150 start_codon:yes stop_codon:yes gene_type:complete